MIKYLVQVIAASLFYFMFGWLVFDFLIGHYTELHTTQIPGFKKNAEDFSLAWLGVSCCAYAALLSFILSYLLHLKNIWRSFVVSAVIGVLIATMTDTYWYASSNFYENGIVVFLDILAAGITVGATGMLITWINTARHKSQN